MEFYYIETPDQYRKLIRSLEFQEVRGFYLDNDTLVLWEAGKHVHSEVITNLKSKNRLPGNIKANVYLGREQILQINEIAEHWKEKIEQSFLLNKIFFPVYFGRIFL